MEWLEQMRDQMMDLVPDISPGAPSVNGEDPMLRDLEILWAESCEEIKITGAVRSSVERRAWLRYFADLRGWEQGEPWQQWRPCVPQFADRNGPRTCPDKVRAVVDVLARVHRWPMNWAEIDAAAGAI